ncbi:MAG: hypothetical protein KA141_04400 [Rubrivivax sp.]|nr:hypothetical protein [Rubrivivax sp.]
MTVSLSTRPLIRPAAALRQSGLRAAARHLLALWVSYRHSAAREAQARQVALDVAQVRRYADAVRAANPGFAADLDMAADQALQPASKGH